MKMKYYLEKNKQLVHGEDCIHAPRWQPNGIFLGYCGDEGEALWEGRTILRKAFSCSSCMDHAPEPPVAGKS